MTESVIKMDEKFQKFEVRFPLAQEEQAKALSRFLGKRGKVEVRDDGVYVLCHCLHEMVEQWLVDELKVYTWPVLAEGEKSLGSHLPDPKKPKKK